MVAEIAEIGPSFRAMMRLAMRAMIIASIALLFAAGAASLAGTPEKEFGVYKAKEIDKADSWINSAPLRLKSLKGKVVVVDFWAFDCEPCIKAMPHVVELHEKYAPQGLVVIGIHTPRTPDERDVTKLRAAVERMGIRFPVAVDGKSKLWRDYLCDLWPSLFVIDREGTVRYSHGGVGRYDDIEEITRKLLEKK